MVLEGDRQPMAEADRLHAFAPIDTARESALTVQLGFVATFRPHRRCVRWSARLSTTLAATLLPAPSELRSVERMILHFRRCHTTDLAVTEPKG